MSLRRFSASQIIEKGDYLDPGFDARSLTISQIKLPVLGEEYKTDGRDLPAQRCGTRVIFAHRRPETNISSRILCTKIWILACLFLGFGWVTSSLIVRGVFSPENLLSPSEPMFASFLTSRLDVLEHWFISSVQSERDTLLVPFDGWYHTTFTGLGSHDDNTWTDRMVNFAYISSLKRPFDTSWAHSGSTAGGIAAFTNFTKSSSDFK
ncbi:hypothetical protein B0H11DRAFT_1915333 [Mycena galericulata]|nr:hypothetical protein B0H11DRAFT_1915333 [Mycena galericulata]